MESSKIMEVLLSPALVIIEEMEKKFNVANGGFISKLRQKSDYHYGQSDIETFSYLFQFIASHSASWFIEFINYCH